MVRSTMAALALLTTATCVRAQQPCPGEGDVSVTIAAVEPRLELRLTDGRRLRLVGLDPAAGTPDHPDLGETSRTALADLLDGRRVTVRILADRPDRWGRWSAFGFLAEQPNIDAPGGVAALAIGKGLGRYLPEPPAHPCRDLLLGAESQARDHVLGLWRDPYYGVLAVDDRAAFAERSATIVVAQGVLETVDVGPYRTKLRFAADPPRDGRGFGRLVAVVLPRTSKSFEGRGVRFEALVGRRMRWRGLLDLHFGPQIELADPDAVEILPEEIPAQAGSASTAGPPTP